MEATLKIDKRVPLPAGANAKRLGMDALLRKLSVGDSFVLPSGLPPYSAHSLARSAEIKVTVRKQKDGYRVWRIK